MAAVVVVIVMKTNEIMLLGPIRNYFYPELFGFFWTLSIVWYVEVYKRPQRFGDWICLRPQVDGTG
jgi:hypothetical protein